jgi:hypothetical protein
VEAIVSPREGRRTHAEIARIRDELGCSLRLAAQVAREERLRGRRAVRNHTPPPQLVREIRRDVEGRAVRS